MSIATLSIGQSEAKPEQNYAAHDLSPSQRQDLALQVLGRSQSVSELAHEHQVSRKFLYQQADKAEQALDEAFQPSQAEDEVLFFLPVTKTWLRQMVLALVLICHASLRGVVELFRDLLDTSISVGSVHNIVTQAVEQARRVNAQEDLSAICIGAHDEIFQSRKPILVGCDAVSTYCYLLAHEQARDATTWGVHLLELEERGLHLDHTLADFGQGLRAGQTQAWSETPCWGDHFHIQQELTKMTTYLENRALAAMSAREKLEKKMTAAKKKAQGQTLSKKLARARQVEEKAIELADEVTLLVGWMQEDILCVVGPNINTRIQLYDFVVDQLQDRQPQAPHRIGPVLRKLENWREELLAFAVDLEKRLNQLAEACSISPHLVWQLFQAQGIQHTDPRYWQQEVSLRRQLGDRFPDILEAVNSLIASTIRASSVVENFNSRLRGYFFLRKHLGKPYLDLLRFFLNHRRFLRSEYAWRQGQSPAEILTGKEHPHWLSLLGFQPFKKMA